MLYQSPGDMTTPRFQKLKPQTAQLRTTCGIQWSPSRYHPPMSTCPGDQVALLGETTKAIKLFSNLKNNNKLVKK